MEEAVLNLTFLEQILLLAWTWVIWPFMFYVGPIALLLCLFLRRLALRVLLGIWLLAYVFLSAIQAWGCQATFAGFGGSPEQNHQRIPPGLLGDVVGLAIMVGTYVPFFAPPVLLVSAIGLFMHKRFAERLCVFVSAALFVSFLVVSLGFWMWGYLSARIVALRDVAYLLIPPAATWLAVRKLARATG